MLGRWEEGYYNDDYTEYTIVQNIGLAGISKSGNTYYISEQTGGVAKAVTNWQQMIDDNLSDISSYQDIYEGYLEDPEYAGADWIQPNIDYFESEIQKMRGFIARGVTYDWTLSTIARENCALSTDPDSVCIYEPYVPMTIQSGYVFDPQAQAWRTFTVPSSDG